MMAENQEMLQNEKTWAQLELAVQNSVVQVVAQVVTFNWREPYQTYEQQENRGSGFFIDADGHLITNAHVVNDAKRIYLHLPTIGKRAIFADIVSFCPDRDLALLRVNEEGRAFLAAEFGAIVPLPFGDSDIIMPTDDVLALGYPLGQHGIKSSIGSISGRESGAGRTLIQMSAPVNPGNSGGPLLNDQAKVIGVVLATVAHAHGIGYAIPINEVKAVLDELYKKKFVRRAVLGAQFNYGTDEHALFFGNPVPAGFYVNNVFAGSLLEKAGVREGDMLYQFNDFRLDDFGEAHAPWTTDKVSIHDLVARLELGDMIHLVLYRAGERIECSFKFELLPPYPIRYIYPEYEEVSYEIIGGMVIMQLAENHLPFLLRHAPDLINYTKIENKLVPQLIIAHVLPGSIVQQARCFTSGFILAECNGVPVNTLAELSAALSKKQKNGLVTFKAGEKEFQVFLLEKIIEDEERLARDFAYSVTPIMKKLMGKK
jgi:S1-C subfamily serine protease